MENILKSFNLTFNWPQFWKGSSLYNWVVQIKFTKKTQLCLENNNNRRQDFCMHSLIYKNSIMWQQNSPSLMSKKKFQTPFSSGDFTAISTLQRGQTMGWHKSRATPILWKYFDNSTFQNCCWSFAIYVLSSYVTKKQKKVHISILLGNLCEKILSKTIKRAH